MLLAERFELEAELGRGRVSTVFLARERGSDREVALRILHRHLREDESVVGRLKRELAAVRRLDHRGILRMEDVVEADDDLAMVMEYVQGRTVRELVAQEGALGWERARALLVQAAAALHHAHRRGVLHRDLGAHHVMVTDDDEVKLIGFGMARVEELVGLTMHTRVLGALEAMAPERILGMDYDGRADIYSLGVVAKEMVSGDPPPALGYGQALMEAMEAGPEQEESWAGIEEEARYILQRALARDVATRFATAEQFGRALQGEYDPGSWQGLAFRGRRRCSKCRAELMEGIASCLQCGHEPRRLVSNPGAGEARVKVLSPYEAFERDFWFESNTEPRWLKKQQFEALMRYLKEYDDTAPFADGRWGYMQTPYDLFQDLSMVEAHRIAAELEERGLHAEVTSKRTRRSIQWILETGGATVSEKTARRGFVAILILAALLLLGFAALFDLGIGMGAIGIALLFTGIYWVRQKVNATSGAYDEDLSGGEMGGDEAMISTEGLQALGDAGVGAILPEQTVAVLAELGDEELRREVRELIALAVMARRRRGYSAEEVRSMLEEVFSVAQRIDAISREVEAASAVELVAQLETARVKLHAAEDIEESAIWVEKRAAILARLARRDHSEYQLAMLRANLMHVRGRLIDWSREQQPVVLEDSSDDVLAELHRVLAAGQEVQALVEGKSL